MAFLNNEAYDQGLDWVDTNGTQIDICKSEPATYAAAVGAESLGNAVVNTGATEDGDTDGRKVIVPAVSGATVDTTGTATHWALTDGSSILVATGILSASQAVTSGNTFNLAAFDITIRDAT